MARDVCGGSKSLPSKEGIYSHTDRTDLRCHLKEQAYCKCPGQQVRFTLITLSFMVGSAARDGTVYYVTNMDRLQAVILVSVFCVTAISILASYALFSLVSRKLEGTLLHSCLAS